MAEENEYNVWMDGSFDMVHFGDVYRLRCAKKCGKTLTVGVNSDIEILRNTGSYPIFSEDERYRLVSSLKFVDQVVEGAPYHTHPNVVEDHNCRVCSFPGSMNKDVNSEESRRRYVLAKQEFEVSCQDIIGRVIRMYSALQNGGWLYSPWRDTTFLPTSETFKLFSNGSKPKPNDKIVYTCGAFDFFNVGHLTFLEKAKSLGDYLVVGIYSDEDIVQAEGCHPVMSLYERALCAFAYKPVDEVILGAPMFIADDMLDRFKINIVVRGSITSASDQERFAVAKKRAILRIIDSGSAVTTKSIVKRIIKTRFPSPRTDVHKPLQMCKDVLDNNRFTQYPVEQQG